MWGRYLLMIELRGTHEGGRKRRQQPSKQFGDCGCFTDFLAHFVYGLPPPNFHLPPASYLIRVRDVCEMKI